MLNDVLDILKKEGVEPGVVEKFLKFSLSKKENYEHGIPTLEKDIYRKPTTMISDRFEFAGAISDMGNKWLGISDMIKIINNKKIIKSILSHKNNWEGSAPAIYSFNQLTLFGITLGEEENQVYLIWNENDGIEPEVWVYSGQAEHKFKNLAEYIKWVIK